MSKDPKVILEVLSKFKGNVDNIYRYLYIPEFYFIAYNNILSSSGRKTPIKCKKNEEISELINKVIQELHDKTYQPRLPKKTGSNKKTIRLEDRLVQEVIRMILEAIYEPSFTEYSHAFRPKRNVHSALYYVKGKFKGTKWWINVDLKEDINLINTHVLLNILSKKIKEQKFLSLINKFLKAGFLSDWKFDKTYSETPIGNILSPILLNIFFHEFDKFMGEKIDKFWSGKKRKIRQEVIYHQSRVQNAKVSVRVAKNEDKRTEMIERLNARQKELKECVDCGGYYDPMDCDFRRLSYVRYLDSFLVGLISSKEEAIQIQNDIKNFIKCELGFEISSDKIQFLHNSQKVRFLGYDIDIMYSKSNSVVNGKIGLWLPHDVMVNFIVKNKFGKFCNDPRTGKPSLKGTHISSYIFLEELEILKTYNAKIMGLYNYYRMALNVCKMNGFNHVVQTSFLRTLAAKYKTTCAKLYQNKNYCNKTNKLNVGITYNNDFYRFFDGPFTVEKKLKYDANIDRLPSVEMYVLSRTSLTDRIEAKKCSSCGNTTGPFEVHHVNKLKNALKGIMPSWLRAMISRQRRKTIVLCFECHKKLHADKL